jgi:hypothetical protein
MPSIDLIFDVSSGLDYGGSERKAAILFNNEPYMLKFAKKNVYGLCFEDAVEKRYHQILQVSYQRLWGNPS